jgi:BON domain-containing protein
MIDNDRLLGDRWPDAAIGADDFSWRTGSDVPFGGWSEPWDAAEHATGYWNEPWRPGAYGIGPWNQWPGYGRGGYAGVGPRGYRRSDERIADDINARLTWSPDLDASDILVSVANGEVTLSGGVDDRWQKRLAGDIADDVAGVRDVFNQLRVRRDAARDDQP